MSATKTQNRMTAIAAAEKVLREAGAPMRVREMIKHMEKKGYWSSPAGKTPHHTLATAIRRHIKANGEASLFRKVEPGLFVINAKRAATSAA